MKYLSKLTIVIGLLMFAGSAISQEGAITKEMLEKYREKIKSNQQVEVLQNAVSNNSIQKLALNQDNHKTYDKYFSHRVETKGITDQKSSGRCWLFTGLNVLRAKVIDERGMKKFEFSQTYNFFYDQLEKSNLFLEGALETADKPMDDKKVEWLFKHVIGDGGQWTGVVNIIEKYGVVPADVMPETEHSENTRWMSRLLTRKLKSYGLEIREMVADRVKDKRIRERKEEMLAEVYKMLVISLGEPPQEFDWRYEDKDGNLTEMKTYTPKSFYDEFVNVNLSEYVMFMNDPSRPYNKLYEIEYDRHTFDGDNWKYINLAADDIKPFAIASIKNDEGMYFSCDVGKQLNSDAGVLDPDNYNYGALFDTEISMTKKERIETFSSASTHGMGLMAVDLDKEGNPRKWLLENSWGEKSGFQGHLIMTDEWFDEYMFRLVIHKQFVSDEVLKILEQEPTMLPPWDPMFMSEK